MYSIQQQELKALSKSCCFGDRLGWLPQYQQTCTVRAADLLCLRKLIRCVCPPDPVAATKTHCLLPIPGSICTTCCSPVSLTQHCHPSNGPQVGTLLGSFLNTVGIRGWEKIQCYGAGSSNGTKEMHIWKMSDLNIITIMIWLHC